MWQKVMRRIALIDGENLTYGLRTLLAGDGEERAPRSVLNNYNFRGLVEDLLSDRIPSEIIWFGARLRRYDNNEEIRVKSEAAIVLQAAFVNMLQNQKIIFHKVGYLRAREGEPCKDCGRREWNLIEKGVDVGLAVKLLTEANDQTELVVVSADTDLVPAFKAVRKTGAKIMHVGYEYRPSSALSSNADSTRIISKPQASKYVENRLV